MIQWFRLHKSSSVCVSVCACVCVCKSTCVSLRLRAERLRCGTRGVPGRSRWGLVCAWVCTRIHTSKQSGFRTQDMDRLRKPSCWRDTHWTYAYKYIFTSEKYIFFIFRHRGEKSEMIVYGIHASLATSWTWGQGVAAASLLSCLGLTHDLSSLKMMILLLSLSLWWNTV